MLTEKLEVGDCLADKEFQDWLARVKILKRTSKSSVLLPVHRTRPSEVYKDLFDLLKSNKGYIIGWDMAAQKLYGQIGKDERNHTAQRSKYLETRLVPNGSFFMKKWVGLALGVKGFLLSYSSIPVVYRLWLSLNGYVSVDNLAIARYGIADPLTRINVVTNVIDPLRLGRLENTNVDIDFLGSLYSKSIKTGTVSFRMFENWQRSFIKEALGSN